MVLHQEQDFKKIFVDLFGERANEYYFNGDRSEGYSIIIVGHVYSREIEQIMNALNVRRAAIYNRPEFIAKHLHLKLGEFYEKPVREWRVRKADDATIVNLAVPEDVKDDCYEVRLIRREFGLTDEEEE
jgi:hypothetical protein